jgi:hypothetical protein
MARRARSRQTGELLEHVFQQQVEALAKFYGWLVYHTHRSDRSAPGFPDVVAVRGPELIFAELKTRTGRVSPQQQTWIDALGTVAGGVTGAVAALDGLVPGIAPNVERPSIEVYVWRPDDFGAIHARFARGRRQVPASFDPRA